MNKLTAGSPPVIITGATGPDQIRPRTLGTATAAVAMTTGYYGSTSQVRCQALIKAGGSITENNEEA